MKQIILLACLLIGAAAPLRGELVSEAVHGPSLADNLIGDDARRNVLVYLPPGYAGSIDRQYPAVYLLHSFNASNRTWLGESGYQGMDVTVLLDLLIRSGRIEPMIVVMPDAANRFGGSWYANSPSTGLWEDFVARDLVSFVDRKYRTVDDRRGRGIAGQSMGAYGALRIAMHFPDVFGAVLGMSAPNLVNPDPLGAPAHEAALSISDGRVAEVPLPGRVIWAKAAAFSPNTTAPPLYADLPFERTAAGIVIRDAIWKKWLQNTLAPQIGAHCASLRDLRIRLEVGSRDALAGESMAFANALTEKSIPFSLVVFEGGHVEGVRRQFETSVFAFFDDFFHTR